MKPNTDDQQKTFFLIPHTHWEGAVFKTREQFLEMGLPIILRALRLLKEHPNYRFTLDQVCFVKPFFERYPEEEAAFRQLVEDGRLAIVGGTDVMLDVNMPAGESFVRQVLYGKGYFRKTLGVDVTVSWQLDTFGHHAQMPQLLKLAGYKSFWFFRGVSDWDVPSEFLWEGIDGSRIPAFWLPHGYAVTYGSPKSLPEFVEFFQQRFDLLAPFSRGAECVGPAGADVCLPEEHVSPLVEEFNRQPDAPFHLRLAVPTDFEATVAQRPNLPIITGELNPIFQGVYSSRIELKQRTRELERTLTTAEKLGVLLNYLGETTDNEILWRAWEPMLFNQAHDLMSGVMTDHVYEDTIRGYDYSQRVADEEVEARLRSYTSRVRTSGDGIPLVVFNPLGWRRTDVAIARVSFTDDGITDAKLVDPDGQAVPMQLLRTDRYDNGALMQAEIAFVARDVPALGHCVYRLYPLSVAEPSQVIEWKEGCCIENEHCRVQFDDAGAMLSLVDKSSGWDVLSGPGNVVAREEDHGDLWEPYRPLDGGSRIAMKEPHPAPQPGQGVLSSDQTDAPGKVRVGPVVSEFVVEHPFGEKGRFSTHVRLYSGMRRVDITTRIFNNDEFVRYRVLFPTSIADGRRVDEIPFGAVARPTGIEFPAQNWMDYSDGHRGIALLNRGLPGNNVSDGTLMLSLMRSTRIVAYGFGGGYEPGMTSDTGLELDRELSFDYALVPHAGDWRAARVYRDGLEFTHPLIAFTASAHDGPFPSRWSFLDVSHPNIVVSAMKPGEESGVALRLYEAAGEATRNVTIELPKDAVKVRELNLIEEPGEQAQVKDGSLRLCFAPFEIQTIGFSSQSSNEI